MCFKRTQASETTYQPVVVSIFRLRNFLCLLLIFLWLSIHIITYFILPPSLNDSQLILLCQNFHWQSILWEFNCCCSETNFQHLKHISWRFESQLWTLFGVKHPQRTGYFCIKHLVSWTKNCNLFTEYKLYLTFILFLSKWDGLVYSYFLLWILVLCICNKQSLLWCKMPSAIQNNFIFYAHKKSFLDLGTFIFSSLSSVIFCHPKSLPS